MTLWLTLNIFSTLAMLLTNMVPSWSPTPARRNPNSGMPNIAYRIQKIFPPSVLGAMLPYPGRQQGQGDEKNLYRTALSKQQQQIQLHIILFLNSENIPWNQSINLIYITNYSASVSLVQVKVLEALTLDLDHILPLWFKECLDVGNVWIFFYLFIFFIRTDQQYC